MTTRSETCPDCGAPLLAGGSCGNCLLLLGLGAAGGQAGAGGEEVASELGRLGDYQLLEEIGHGGMGLVYRARQISLNREVALKIIAAGAFATPAMIGRFRNEAEAAAAMDHPNIVPVYEVGESGGQHYLSMRLIEGATLAARREDVGSREVLRSLAARIAKVARAVAYAHRRGILHRDIKPANVLLDGEGEPHLSDFGLAKILEDQTDMTMTVAVLGTPAYMAPEQASGSSRGLTTAADIYSLGAVLYDLITGAPPFTGKSTIALLKQVIDSEPLRPSAANRMVDRDLETICLKCLEKDPERRYDSALGLAEDIERWLADEPIEARQATTVERTIKWVRRRPFKAALIGVTLLFLVTVGIGGTLFNLRLQKANDEIAARAEERRQSLIGLTEDNGLRYFEQGDFYSALPWFVAALKLEEGEPGRELVHRQRIGVALRAAPRLVHVWRHHESRGGKARFSTDGRRLIMVPDEGDRLRVVDLETGSDAFTPIHAGAGTIEEAVFSGDGKLIAVAVETDAGGGEARLYESATGEALPLELRHGSAVIDVAFPADRQRLMSAGADGEVKFWDIATGKLLLTLDHGDTIETAAIDAGGRRVVTGGKLGKMKAWDSISGEAVFDLICQAGRTVRKLAFSEDGSRLVVTTGEGVEVLDADTGEPQSKVLSHGGRWVFDGDLSASQKFVASCGRDGAARVRNIASGELAFAPLEHAHGVRTVSYSPDGTSILTASDDRTAVIWNAATGKRKGPPLRHPDGIVSASYSPDGSMVVTTSPQETRLWSLVTTLRAGPIIIGTPTRRAGFRGSSYELVTAGQSNEIRRWEIDTGRKIGTASAIGAADLPPNPFQRPELPFPHPDGVRETVIEENRVFLRDRSTGESLVTPLEHREYVSFARISADGSRVFTGSGDRSARVWDMDTGKPITPPLPSESTVYNVAVSVDGERLATFSNGSWIGTWNLSPDRRPAAQLEALATLLTGIQIDPKRGPVGSAVPPGLEVLAGGALPSAREHDHWVWNKMLAARMNFGEGYAQRVIETGSRRASLAYKRGRFAEMTGNFKLAARYLKQAAIANPGDPGLFEHLGRVSARLQDWELSEQFYRKAVEIEPGRTSSLHGLGVALTARAGWEAGLEPIAQAVASNPGAAQLIDYHAEWLAGLKRWEEALSLFREAALIRQEILVSDGGREFATPIPRRDPSAPDSALDLTDFYTNPPHHFIKFDEIPGEDITAIPQGLMELDGIRFDARGAIRLTSSTTDHMMAPFPDATNGIPVRRECDRLHFLHTAQFEAPVGTVYAVVSITFADGTRTQLPLRYGHQAWECYYAPDKALADPGSRVAWTAGQPRDKGNPTAFLTTWDNPKPDVEIMMIHIGSTKSPVTPLVFAISAE